MEGRGCASQGGWEPCLRLEGFGGGRGPEPPPEAVTAVDAMGRESNGVHRASAALTGSRPAEECREPLAPEQNTEKEKGEM
jgi:hypothetical protein